MCIVMCPCLSIGCFASCLFITEELLNITLAYTTLKFKNDSRFSFLGLVEVAFWGDQLSEVLF